MTLQQFISLMVSMMFQRLMILQDKENVSIDAPKYREVLKAYQSSNDYYKNRLFDIPTIYCEDGFHLDISVYYDETYPLGTENGVNEFGLSFDQVRFFNQSAPDEILDQYHSNGVIHCCNIHILQIVLNNHGGIDWEKTSSVENLKPLILNE